MEYNHLIPHREVGNYRFRMEAVWDGCWVAIRGCGAFLKMQMQGRTFLKEFVGHIYKFKVVIDVFGEHEGQ